MVDTRRSSAAKRRGPTEESSPAPPPPTQAEAAASPTTAGAPAEPASTPPPPSSRSRSGKRAKVAVRPLFVHSCGVSVGATDGLIDLTPPPPLLFARLRGWRNPATRRWTRPRSTCSTAPSRTCRAWRGRPPSTSPRPPPSPIPQVRGGFRRLRRLDCCVASTRCIFKVGFDWWPFFIGFSWFQGGGGRLGR